MEETKISNNQKQPQSLQSSNHNQQTYPTLPSTQVPQNLIQNYPRDIIPAQNEFQSIEKPISAHPDTTVPTSDYQSIQLHKAHTSENQRRQKLLKDDKPIEKVQNGRQQQNNRLILQNCPQIQELNSPTIKSIHQRLSFTEGRQESANNDNNSNQFFMSIRSSQSEVAFLDEEHDHQANNHINLRRQQESIKFQFSARQFNQTIVDDKENNTKQKANSQFIQNQKLNDQMTKNRQIFRQQHKILIQDARSTQSIFTMVKTEEITIDNFQSSTNQIMDKQSQILDKPIQSETLLKGSKKQLSLIQNINLTVNSQSSSIPELQSTSSMANSIVQKINQKEQVPPALKQKKSQPLDMKTLSVLTLSSPEAIKSIKPPQPKVQGERKIKFWEKSRRALTLIQPPSNKPDQPVLPSSLLPSMSLVQPNQAEIVHPASGPTYELLPPPRPAHVPPESVLRDQPPVAQSTNNSIINQNRDIKDPITNASAQNGIASLIKREISQIPVPKQVVIQQDFKDLNKLYNHYQTLGLNDSTASSFILGLQPKQANRLNLQSQPALPNLQVSDIAPQINPPQQRQVNNQQRLILIENNIQPAENQQQNNLPDRPLPQNRSPQIKLQRQRQLQQLKEQIQRQKKINQQLEISSSLASKLLLSLSTGLIVGGLSYAYRKNKLASLLLTLAVSVSSFILKK